MAPIQGRNKLDKKRKEGEEEEIGKKNLLCCVPREKVECSKPLIVDVSSCVRVVCSSAVCPESGLMHAACFSKYTSCLLLLMGRVGRARTWSDKQRQANLWTKGYDLVFKSAACNCGHGSIRKDLESEQQAKQAEPKKVKSAKVLKPKLNTSWQPVQGATYYSKAERMLETEGPTDIPSGGLKKRHSSRTESSLSQPSPPPTSHIPGLSPEHKPSPSYNQETFPALPIAKSKGKSDRKSAPPDLDTTPDDGWVKVGRRNSFQTPAKKETTVSKTDEKDVKIPKKNLLKRSESLTQNLGARPKETSFMSKKELEVDSEEVVHLSFGANGQRDSPLNLPSAPVSPVPQWDDFPVSPGSGRARSGIDAEMEILSQQSHIFRNSLKDSFPEKIEESSVGKRDNNGFIECSSCRTVHSSTAEFSAHCRSSQHQNTVLWAHRLEGADQEMGMLTNGWEMVSKHSEMGKTTSKLGNFDHFLPKYSPQQPLPFSEDFGGFASFSVSSEKVTKLKKELEALKEEKWKADERAEAYSDEIKSVVKSNEELKINYELLLENKESLEANLKLVEQSLKTEEDTSQKLRHIVETLKKALDEREGKITETVEKLESYYASGHQELSNTQEELKEITDKLVKETQKNEISAKIVKSLKEQNAKLESAVKAEKDSLVLSEKSYEMSELRVKKLEQFIEELQRKNYDLEDKLKLLEKDVSDNAIKESDIMNMKTRDETILILESLHEESEVQFPNFSKFMEVIVQRITSDNLTIVNLEKSLENERKKCEDVACQLEEIGDAMYVADNNSVMIDKIVKFQDVKDNIVSCVDKVLDALTLKAGSVDDDPKLDFEDLKLMEETTKSQQEENFQDSASSMLNARDDVGIINCSSRDDDTRENKLSNDSDLRNFTSSSDCPHTEEEVVEMLEAQKNELKKAYNEIEDYHESNLFSSLLSEQRINKVRELCASDNFSQSGWTFNEESGLLSREDGANDCEDVDHQANHLPDSADSQEIRDVDDGLDRYPQLGLDDEISSYLGSRTSSALSGPSLDIESEEKCHETHMLKGNDHEEQSSSKMSLGSISSDSAVEIDNSEQESVKILSANSRTSSSDSNNDSCADDRIIFLEAAVGQLTDMVSSLTGQLTDLKNQIDSSKDSSFNDSRNSNYACEFKNADKSVDKSVEECLSEIEIIKEDVGLKSNKVEVKRVTEEVVCMRDNFLKILSNCEKFQNEFDGLSEEQKIMKDKLDSADTRILKNNTDKERLDNEVFKLNKKIASLVLENQVETSNTRQAMDRLQYEFAVLNSKMSRDLYSPMFVHPSSHENCDPDFSDKVSHNSLSSSPPDMSVSDKAGVGLILQPEEENDGVQTEEALKMKKGGRGRTRNSLVPIYHPAQQSALTNFSGGNLWLSPDGGTLALQPSFPSCALLPRPYYTHHSPANGYYFPH